MFKRILIAFCLVSLVGGSYMSTPILGSPRVPLTAILSTTPTKSSGATTVLESCFNYYDYDKVDVNFSSDKASYNSDFEKEIVLTGNIINRNDFPLVGISLIAQIRRINTTTYLRNGHHLVDSVQLLNSINLQSDETKNFTLTIPIETSYPKGEYQIQYYVLSPKGFHYAGRSFLEEDYAGTTHFSISSTAEADIYWNLDEVTVNSEKVFLRDMIKTYPEGPVLFKISATVKREDSEKLPVTIRVYSFENDIDRNLMEEKQVVAENGIITYQYTPPHRGAYVFEAHLLEPQRSILKYRFAAEHAVPGNIRMNDLGVSSFPANENSKAWVCFHSPTNALTPITEIRLEVFDEKGNSVSSSVITQAFSPEVQAIAIPLLNLKSKDDFRIESKAVNRETGKKVFDESIHFTCDLFKDSLSELKLKYSPRKPDQIEIEALNACGKAIKTDLFVDKFILKKSKDLVIEKTNFEIKHNKISIGDLDQGVYEAEIQKGRFKDSIQIRVEQPNLQEKSSYKTIVMKWVVSAIIIAIAIILSIIVVRKT
ncbi:hypothetical protein KAZ66_00640 [Candidatus Woesebacteria bacterium]|nr:hypothetical protein [Candidatus Woesebacteria bacterium]